MMKECEKWYKKYSECHVIWLKMIKCYSGVSQNKS